MLYNWLLNIKTILIKVVILSEVSRSFIARDTVEGPAVSSYLTAPCLSTPQQWQSPHVSLSQQQIAKRWKRQQQTKGQKYKRRQVHSSDGYSPRPPSHRKHQPDHKP